MQATLTSFLPLVLFLISLFFLPFNVFSRFGSTRYRFFLPRLASPSLEHRGDPLIAPRPLLSPQIYSFFLRDSIGFRTKKGWDLEGSDGSIFHLFEVFLLHPRRFVDSGAELCLLPAGELYAYVFSRRNDNGESEFPHLVRDRAPF
ncbi:hypothetical protein OPV22_007924 [Ensete ventricosum]|uniref:Uncharacterized protein n=1 Tax=Ensete ventricosum TaxID=4639 RepID=A0AAV8RFT6_ENSVE|nr:hypothetical protein OPV22_007924 [Ensete ventricosum]